MKHELRITQSETVRQKKLAEKGQLSRSVLARWFSECVHLNGVGVLTGKSSVSW